MDAGADEQSAASEADLSREGAMEEPIVALPSVVIVGAGFGGLRVARGAPGVAHWLPQSDAGAGKLGLELLYLRSCGTSH